MSNQLKLRVAGATDVGLKRQVNEDAFFLAAESRCFSVADGVGGANAGEVASQLFISTITQLLKGDVASDEEAASIIKQIFSKANNNIFISARNNSDQRGMGCTAELLLFHDQRFTLGHVGDSRSYRYRDGGLTQLTKDHSLVQDQLDQGKISDGDVQSHRYRNVILRAVGTEETLDVDLVRGAVKVGDSFLLCSDGLTDMVDETTISNCLKTSVDVEQKVQLLIDLANKAGGKDNITVIIVETRA